MDNKGNVLIYFSMLVFVINFQDKEMPQLIQLPRRQPSWSLQEIYMQLLQPPKSDSPAPTNSSLSCTLGLKCHQRLMG